MFSSFPCRAEEPVEQPVEQPPPPLSVDDPAMPRPQGWLDRMHRGTYNAVWRSSMYVDHLFGSKYDEKAYQTITGSIAPALLWDEFGGFKPRLRFNLNIPLPQLNERFYAFIGRVDPEEYVTERAPDSGAFHRQYGPRSEDETVLGISYHEPRKEGYRFDAGAGVRLKFPPDPYIKGSFIYERGKVDGLLFGFRETGFVQRSEGLGATTRFDFTRAFAETWLLSWTTSGTISQKSLGVKGYSSLMGLHALSERRAIALAVGFDGEQKAEVPLHDYGVKFAYRQRISREWLVMELRSSLTWPKEVVDRPREPSWGVGIGFEMMFGTDDFLARPVTF